MNNYIQLPVLIAGMRTKVDGSIKIELETRELTPDMAGSLYGMRNAEAWVVIAPSKMTDVEIPKSAPEAGLNAKTPSSRLRAVMFVKWKQQNLAAISSHGTALVWNE